MSTWLVDSAGTTIPTGHRITISGLNETHQLTRSFYKVDLTGSGLTAADVDNAVIRLYCSATAGGGLTDAHFYCGDATDNWATSLSGDLTCFNSTRVYLEQEFPITATGYHRIPIAVSHLDFSGMNWFTMNAGSVEYTYGVNMTISATVASQDNATAAFRPILILYLKAGGIKVLNLFVEEISIDIDKEYDDIIQMSGLKSNNYFGDSADGYVRKIDIIATGDPYDPGA